MFLYLCGFLLVILTYFAIKFYLNVRKYPPGPMPYPIIGNLFQINESDPVKSFQEWGSKYGPVFTVWLPLPHVVLNDYTTIQETLVKRADIFAGRPFTWATNFFNHGNYGIVFATDELWREQRRFALHTLRDFGFGKKRMERRVMDQCHETIVEQFRAKSGQVFSPASALQACILNVINELLFGYTFKVDDPVYTLLNERLDDLLTAFSDIWFLLFETAPWLARIPYVFGHERVVESQDAFTDYFKAEIEKQQQMFDENVEATNYAQAFLKEINERKKQDDPPVDDSFSRWQLVVALGDMWTAGMETTVVTLRYALLFMLNHPEMQDKAREEIQRTIGQTEVTMEDQKRMPYVQAILTEVQRLANILPVNLQHTVNQDVTINGFSIQKDTIILPQFSTVHMDSMLFPDPTRFNPDRHLNPDGSIKRSEHVTPFLLGKRSCMGESLARMELFLIFVSMLQKFRFIRESTEKIPTEGKVRFVRFPQNFQCLIEAI